MCYLLLLESVQSSQQGGLGCKIFGELEIVGFTLFCEESYDAVNYFVSWKYSSLYEDSHSNLLGVVECPFPI